MRVEPGGPHIRRAPLRDLRRRRAHQETDDAENVVDVHVRKKNVAQREGDAVAHHLALGALSAVEQERLAFTNDRDRADTPLDGRARR